MLYLISIRYKTLVPILKICNILLVNEQVTFYTMVQSKNSLINLYNTCLLAVRIVERRYVASQPLKKQCGNLQDNPPLFQHLMAAEC